MTKITLIGIALSSILALVGMTFEVDPRIIGWAIGAVAGITGVHNIARGFEDGLTKFKAAATANGKGK